MLPRDTLRNLGDGRFREMDSLGSMRDKEEKATRNSSSGGSLVQPIRLRVFYAQRALSRLLDPLHQPLDVQGVDRRLAVPVALKVDALCVRRKHRRNLLGVAGTVLA